jgi:hypothetical protein
MIFVFSVKINIYDQQTMYEYTLHKPRNRTTTVDEQGQVLKEVLARGTGSLSSEEPGTCQDNGRKPASECTHQLSSTKPGLMQNKSGIETLRGSHSLLRKEPESG